MPTNAELEAASRAICRINGMNPDRKLLGDKEPIWKGASLDVARAALKAAEKIRRMPDDKRKRGAADRRKAASGQDYEVAHIAKKFGVSRNVVRDVIAHEGHSRRKIYAWFRSRRFIER